ncbi:HCLS1-associated protein X-1 [Neosynchiropus ocellatus]
MSVFDLFRGFFGVPGGHYRGQRDPFFDAMVHDDDDDEDDDDFYGDDYRGDRQEPFDRAWRFGFSLGPDGMKIQEPPVFGQVLREMEEMFSMLERWDGTPNSGLPSILPPHREGVQKPPGASSGNPLRDYMLKSPDSAGPPARTDPPREPRADGPPGFGRSPFHGWSPFSKFHDMWGPEPVRPEKREDKDLDSAVSSGGLDQILSPPTGQNQPRSRSFFHSVTVTKVVKPDGSVEERRTVRDGQGNEETTVTRSGGFPEGADPHSVPALPGAPPRHSDLRDDSFFSKLFGGFR